MFGMDFRVIGTLRRHFPDFFSGRKFLCYRILATGRLLCHFATGKKPGPNHGHGYETTSEPELVLLDKFNNGY